MTIQPRNDNFDDRDGHPVQMWTVLVNGHLYGLSYTSYPQWTVKHEEFELPKAEKEALRGIY